MVGARGVRRRSHAGRGVRQFIIGPGRRFGRKQATYDGHPLYTYVSDTAPGQASGNGTNLDGGVWHEVIVP